MPQDKEARLRSAEQEYANEVGKKWLGGIKGNYVEDTSPAGQLTRTRITDSAVNLMKERLRYDGLLGDDD
jgi:hypothetical protein